MNQITLEKIIQELQGDKETYLVNCKYNYSEYVEAAQILFPDYYRKIDHFKSLFPLIEESLKYKEKGDLSTELKILEQAANFETDIPYVYYRLAIVYSKQKDFKKAQAICQKWFNSVYWKIPNMATTSLKIFKRLEKLNLILSK